MFGSLFSLHWRDIDPATHSWDPAPLREIVERHIRKLSESLPKVRNYLLGDQKQSQCEHELNLELATKYGLWVTGWTWSSSEPGGGGPVSSYCCPRDSLLPKNDTVEKTIARVIQAISEWRVFLEEVADMQAELKTKTADCSPETAIEIIATHYLPIAVKKSQCNDAWYNLHDKLLTWHFESLGHDDVRIRQTIIHARSGKFESWIQPEPPVTKEVIAQLSTDLAEVLTAPVDTTDSLFEWLKVRRKTQWQNDYRHVNHPLADGHLAFIDRYDVPRSVERAKHFRAALDFIRKNASTPLTWPLLRTAQERVLNEKDVDFRTGDAFAKGGRERYGLDAKTRKEFEKCLSEANDSSISVHARAARVYLDVCFFHPFVDGNARAARLALDRVLMNAGLCLTIADPLFLYAAHARDPDVGWRFQYLVSALAGPMKTD